MSVQTSSSFCKWNFLIAVLVVILGIFAISFTSLAQQEPRLSDEQNAAKLFALIETLSNTTVPEKQIEILVSILRVESSLIQWPLNGPRDKFKGLSWTMLGDSYTNRPSGERGENMELAIKSYQAALKFATKDAFPEDWAKIQRKLAHANSNRIRGLLVDNIENTLKAYEAALTVFTRGAFPEDWARTQGDLAITYGKRIRGDRSANIEEAIKGFKTVLSVFTREAFLEEWMDTQNNLANSYRIRIQGERADNVETAINIGEEVLRDKTRESLSRAWSQTQHNLALALLDRIRGSRSQNIERAIEAFTSALSIRTRNSSPENWAQSQAGIGRAFAARIQGERADNIEKAIIAEEAALTVLTPDAYPRDWADIQVNRATAFQNRIRGQRSSNLEEAIAGYKAAHTIYTRESAPGDWATVHNNLANAYGIRLLGDRADNLELAIRGYEAALAVHTPEAFAKEWAVDKYNLANAYLKRIRGIRSKNLEQAISAFHDSLKVHSRESFPQDWAETQNSLANAYVKRIDGDRADNLERAINGFRAALTVRTRDALPREWASTQNNLGIAYSERLQGDRADNIEQAIAAFHAALTFWTRENAPQEWGDSQHNLGITYRRRLRGVREENLSRAMHSFREALTVRTPDFDPRAHLQSARWLGEALSLNRDWLSARDVYSSARKAFFLLFGDGLNDVDARGVIEEAGPLFVESAYVETQIGNREAALDLLNAGKARLMSVALLQQVLNLTPEKLSRYASLKVEIRDSFYRTEAMKGAEGAQELLHLAQLRSALSGLLQEGMANKTASGGAMILARSLLPKGGAIVAPIITGLGAKIMIVANTVRGANINILDLPELTTEKLRTLLRGDGRVGASGGWLGAYAIQYLPWPEQGARLGEWRSAIDGIGPALWKLFAGRLDAELLRLGVQSGGRLIWLPAGSLGLLPLGLAQDPDSSRRFVDAYEIVYAPNLDALASASDHAGTVSSASLVAVVNPTGDTPKLSLPFAEIEGALVAAHFSGKPAIRLDKSDASPENVMSALQGKSYWHFSSHGSFDWADVSNAGLLLKAEKPLTVGMLLAVQGGLGRPRLVVMSACESGLFAAAPDPDEFIGLPESFMQIGAIGVVSTLWQVDDLATALLMAKFYELHLDQNLAPALALKQSQIWIRSATTAELLEFAKIQAANAKLDPSSLDKLASSLKSSRRSATTRSNAIWNLLQEFAANAFQRLQSHPFAHPYYWSGFVYTGA